MKTNFLWAYLLKHISKAEAVLGPKFDIREFHEVILEEGTVTLPILEKRINQYIDKKKNGTYDI